MNPTDPQDPNQGDQPGGAPVTDPNAGQSVPEAPVSEPQVPETPAPEAPVETPQPGPEPVQPDQGEDQGQNPAGGAPVV